MRQNTFYPRPVAPTAAQVSFMFLSMQWSINLSSSLPDKVRVRTFPPVLIQYSSKIVGG
jgi:hypothetical protein